MDHFSKATVTVFRGKVDGTCVFQVICWSDHDLIEQLKPYLFYHRNSRFRLAGVGPSKTAETFLKPLFAIDSACWSE